MSLLCQIRVCIRYHRRSPCNSRNIRFTPIYILFKARNGLHFGFHITLPPTYFHSFSTVISLLLASDDFIYLNKLAATFYPAPFRLICLYFDIFFDFLSHSADLGRNYSIFTTLLLHICGVYNFFFLKKSNFEALI